MEHEAFVPVPGERLRAALADPVRVARAVPGFQQDAGSGPLSGRLKVRVGGAAITYRGALRLTAREDGTYAAEGEAAEARGSGKVTFALTVRLKDTAGGSTVVFGGTASADGRIGRLPADTVTASVTRLLNRFAQNLARPAADAAPSDTAHTGARDAEPSAAGKQNAEPKSPGKQKAEPDGPDDQAAGPNRPEKQAAGPKSPGDQGAGPDGAGQQAAGAEAPPSGAEDSLPPASDVSGLPVSDVPQDTGSLATEDFEPAATGDFEAGPDADDAPPPPPPARGTGEPAAAEDAPPGPDDELPPPDTTKPPAPEPATPPAPDAEITDTDPVPLDSDIDAHVSVFDTAVPPSSLDAEADDDDTAGLAEAEEPPAEAAHARRTMIGRSAEEVDHAPPRGRYAPVPAPQATAATSVLRWAAPAAALALASAIVVGRALRRRR